ncbi:MAG: Gfo/Idh/MocA family oxidoreductase [Flavobacteriaceae bacterium]|nr:Gfo/Idh/MocA family oxidoreductase [Flavobacteriaceae bacterium]
MKFLIVGGGSIGQRHLNNLKSLGYDNLYCYKRKSSSDFEEKYNCKVITNFDEVQSIQPDVIVICNPTSMHVDWVKIANNLKAHVFVEKPLTHLETQLDDVKSEWNNNSVFFIGFMLRYHPLVKKIKELIDSNRLGRIYSARLEFGSWLPYWHPWEDHKISYASNKNMGGGVINTITHELDLVQYFFGNPISMKSKKANFDFLDIEVEEIAESILIYEDKLVTLHVDFLQKDYDRNIKILGEKGRIIWDWHTNKVDVKLHKDTEEEHELNDFDVNQLYIDEMKDFINLIENNCINHPLDFKHAVSNTELMLEMHKEN